MPDERPASVSDDWPTDVPGGRTITASPAMIAALTAVSLYLHDAEQATHDGVGLSRWTLTGRLAAITPFDRSRASVTLAPQQQAPERPARRPNTSYPSGPHGT